jgi:hypothetical protein
MRSMVSIHTTWGVVLISSRLDIFRTHVLRLAEATRALSNGFQSCMEERTRGHLLGKYYQSLG